MPTVMDKAHYLKATELVLNWSTLQRQRTESTLEPPTGFEPEVNANIK